MHVINMPYKIVLYPAGGVSRLQKVPGLLLGLQGDALPVVGGNPLLLLVWGVPPPGYPPGPP